jgi:hypothetical protein
MHGATTKKAVHFTFAAVRTSDITQKYAYTKKIAKKKESNLMCAV